MRSQVLTDFLSTAEMGILESADEETPDADEI